MTRGLLYGVVLTLALLTATGGHAHTLASTIVSAAMDRPGTVSITIAADADPLIAKLEALASIPASELPATAEGRRVRIESLFPALRAHIEARVAGTPLMLELQDVTVDDTAKTEVRLSARLPGMTGAGPHERVDAFTWRCTFIFGAYQFVSDRGRPPEWLHGPQTSAPAALERVRAEAQSPAPRFIRVGHSLAMGALVVYVISRRRRSS